MQKLTCDEIIAAVKKANGNLTAAARILGVTRQTLYNYRKRYKTVNDAIEEQRETMLDNAESVLYRAVLNGEAWAVCFFLKTQGKKRGYIERLQQESTGEITVRVVRDSKHAH